MRRVTSSGGSEVCSNLKLRMQLYVQMHLLSFSSVIPTKCIERVFRMIVLSAIALQIIHRNPLLETTYHTVVYFAFVIAVVFVKLLEVFAFFATAEEISHAREFFEVARFVTERSIIVVGCILGI